MQQGSNRRLGKFELVERLGGGGMAEVYRARLHGPGGFVKEVALKLILPQFSDEPEFVEMFIREATVAASLDHASIVRIHEFDQIDGTYYIAMELVDGRDLRALIGQAKRLGFRIKVEEALAIALEIARGLAFAHGDYSTEREPVVHRDISPHNIILSRAGEVKITDFGIAKMASAASLTKTGVVKGKAAYMSPEQARGEPVDGRSDIFSLGCVLWELLTGQRLFSGENDFAILEKLQHGDILPCSTFNPAVSKEVDGIVLKALQREPGRRFQTASEMASQLDRALVGLCEDRTTLLVDLFRRMFSSQRPKTAILPAAANSSGSEQENGSSQERQAADNPDGATAQAREMTGDASAAESMADGKSGYSDGEGTGSGHLPAMSENQDVNNQPTAFLPVDRRQEPTILLAGDGAVERDSRTRSKKTVPVKILAPILVAAAVAGGYLLFWYPAPAGRERADGGKIEANEIATKSSYDGEREQQLVKSPEPVGQSKVMKPQPGSGSATGEDKEGASGVGAEGRRNDTTKVAGLHAPVRKTAFADRPSTSQAKKPSKKPAREKTRARDGVAKKKDRTAKTKRKKAGAARVKRGIVDINVIPWARVYWRGKSLGDTPLRGVVLPAGVQKLLLVNNKLGVKKYVKLKVVQDQRVVKVFDITK